MVSIVKPEKSDDELLRITNCAETILQKLSLPYRVMLLCSGDTGFSSKKLLTLRFGYLDKTKEKENIEKSHLARIVETFNLEE